MVLNNTYKQLSKLVSFVTKHLTGGFFKENYFAFFKNLKFVQMDLK